MHWAGSVLPAPPPERLTLPGPPAPPSRSAFPLVATLAPVVVSLVLWMLTQSIYSLLFAVLGPVVALGGLVDGRVGRRRAVRRDRERYLAALARTAESVAAAHGREVERLEHLTPPPGAATAWGDSVNRPLPVRIGRGTIPSAVELSGEDPDGGDGVRPPAADLAAAVRDVRSAAANARGAPLVVDARDGVGITGPPVLAAAVARSIAVQLASRLSPAHASLTSPSGEEWASDLPHGVSTGEPGRYRWDVGDDASVVVSWAENEADLPPGLGINITTGARTTVAGGGVADEPHDVRPGACSKADAGDLAQVLRSRAAAHGIRATGHGLPARVSLSELFTEPTDETPVARQASLPAVIGRDADGPVVVDLVGHGPHAVIGGTTGSGKSELLIAWILAIAAVRSPDEVAFVLVDFKGGSAFAPLVVLPHVLATLSDLDGRRTQRAIESLRAELQHRERVLADAGARSIDDLAPGRLPRLVIVVDEFAAVVSASPRAPRGVR